ncbi:hypothetical protein H101_06714 [Trichophyton interdigitale H6]|nr:hypothetical protein H101_06714 [Trichophyton interdigitale H6]
MDNRSVSEDTSWENSHYAPTPGCSPAYFLSPSPHRILPQQPPERLGFLPLAEWKDGDEFDAQPPQYICYTIEWKLALNHKKVGSATEKDLVVAPSEYWEDFLREALENMLQTKRKRNQQVRPESTAIKVSVNDRTQGNLEKFYSSTDINWIPVEAQLRKWSNLLRIGKRLTVTITFNYRQDDGGDDPLPTTRRGEKRGRVSATTTMLAERDAFIAAEEASTGQPSSWSLVYELMQCNVSSCQLNSDWCWEDPKDGKHYKLRQPHIERLCDYVDNGGRLEGHDDVPRDIRRDLALESQAGRKFRKSSSSATGVPYPPVSINVLPAQAPPASLVTSSSGRPSSVNEQLVIPGPREESVREYCKWLESQATEEAYKADFRKVCKVTLDNLLDLELILKNPNPSFFTQFLIERGIKPGTALHFVGDINEWAKHVKANSPQMRV